ncbi:MULTISPECIES: homogentisate 1,2-dioxygenase [unclassified Variovorax]|uniref:homogentisate 1,2-dioxygenase n=1 Tax=unclassified Variovorax TaxID=663243 RepID=UPI00076D6FE6|nr:MULTISPECIES: homogentisate 1,2-dioxygenase [unclassified Variovorax]KWT92001.1 Homogentisate 1,2-dioxygenase [Variovorax sp. WDL1]PNG51506.1 Homogentisate 1,2-dioxygenase [Variovorax sp. B2]PNG54468.1 Homogentisate 1,2-dioxygenase [Variovorax sp. B4]VTV11975.1 Homogentisate 1,2-dioxygenase [Variovorax sp. WDL1]
MSNESAAERRYQSGFGNEYASEAVAGALPQGRNSPQRAPFDLYPELISGTAFTAPRHENRRSWLYRRQPSVVSGRYEAYAQLTWQTGPDRGIALAPEPMRWHPMPFTGGDADFVDGMHTLAANGDSEAQCGLAAHVYLANKSMQRRAFVNADGELLVVPQQGRLVITTEMGVLDVKPGEIALLPRGVVFKVALPDSEAGAGPSRGYVCENYGAQFRLPELGPIGSNGLANARDFQAPVAAFESEAGGYELVKKSSGRLWRAPMKQSPFNVVAWHGNLAPVKYDTAHFMTIGSISFDHPDPSIFTVLTSPSDTPGTANCDFVIFPPRWMVAEDTFRPPWYHRNLMSEFMGLVYGEYDAKPGGFKPGGASLHNVMVPHGPDEEAFEKASGADLKPQKLDNTLAFMFESRYRFIPTAWALQSPALDNDYADCWAGLQDRFKP